ncbi:hypothetical protein BOTBODRAFT_448469 [Botryobasidium botryosum FD-172 SS1]|uniref:Uncharacterized protein n=1 Tax=Botryobasidium botryosum (strain FD-172 SS1) TaxID=930990 RepID=A0A067MID3_BOTB1|nr:hypothetical protein BOTBODRAFT_448469 [Botryobasidium botryosum FD-172 SS1]
MARAAELKQDLTDVLVPAMDRIRLVHDHLEQTTEVDYATGVVECDQACDELFATSMTDLEELRVAMEESQVILLFSHRKFHAYMILPLTRLTMDQNNLKHLFSQLKQEYEQRDHLWDEFIDDFNTLSWLPHFSSLIPYELVGFTGALSLTDQNARESLNGLSTSVEATISTVDKKCKSLVAEKKKGGLEMDKIKAMIAATS